MKSILLIFSLISVSYTQVIGDVRFFFVGTTTTDYSVITSASQFSEIYNTKYYSATKRTAIFTHGWNAEFSAPSAQTIVSAYLKRGDHNIVVIDWSKYSLKDYITAVTKLPNIADLIANILNQMKPLGFDLSNVHLIGHSLGAQLSGMIGTNFKSTKNFVSCRITGLDPAGPLFLTDTTTIASSFILMPELGRNDAKFVDIIHTDAGELGTKDGRGHIDFFPNGGKIQAGCAFACITEGLDGCLSCSHSRAVKFYAESVARLVVPPLPFLAKQCNAGVTSFTRSNCPGPKTMSMGYWVNGGSVGVCDASGTIHGNFYLETNGSPPYSL